MILRNTIKFLILKIKFVYFSWRRMVRANQQITHALFLKWFKKQNEQNPKFLKNFKFAVFGLGNIDYDYYNAMGKKFNKMFEDAGG